MPRGFRSAKKDQFDDLDSDFKDAAASMSPDELNARIAEVAKNEQENLKLKTEDEDLKAKKAQATEAGKVYKEGSKQNTLRIKFLMRVLGDKGKV
jgi:hypothetical protein